MPILDVEQLKKVKGERQRVSFTSELPFLTVEGEKYEFTKPLQFDLVLTNIGNGINVEGSMSFEIKVECSRCLENISFNMDAMFNEVYYDKTFQVSVKDNEEWIAYSGDTIDITPEALGTILINVPLRFICHEECRGLCPVCGVNLNQKQCDCVQEDTDPRLAKLKELLK